MSERDQPPDPSEDAFLREKPPSAEPIPPWMFAIFAALLFAATVYFFSYSAGFRADVFDASKAAWDGAGATAGVAEDSHDPLALGRRLFSQNCALCHQPNGQGIPGQFPPLAGSEWVAAEGWRGDNHLVRIVLHGAQGPMTVRDHQYNSTMAPWGEVFTDAQIAAILTYVRSQWGNHALPISTDFVAKIRAESQSQSEPWTQHQLQALGREMELPPETLLKVRAGDLPSSPPTPLPNSKTN